MEELNSGLDLRRAIVRFVDDNSLASADRAREVFRLLTLSRIIGQLCISAHVADELRDPRRVRSCVLRIVYKGRGEKDDNIKATYEINLYPPRYYEAVSKGAWEASIEGRQDFPVPAPDCRGYVRLADLECLQLDCARS